MRGDVPAALVVVDVQRDYFPGGAWALEGAEAAGRAVAALLAEGRRAGVPAFHVRHLAPAGAPFFVEGTAGAEFHPLAAPLPGEPLVDKSFPNAFRGTGLEVALRAAGAGTLVVCGMMTHMCVDATVRAAKDLGFRVIVPVDCVATRALELGGRRVAAADVQAAFLAAMGGVYAELTDAAGALALARKE